MCGAGRRVRSKYLTLTIPWRLASADRADVVMVPGVEDVDRPVPAEVRSALRRAVDRGACVASICTGAFVLASAGVLDGLRATTHWMIARELARRHPRVSVAPDVLYVDNGQILTSAGAAAGLDLCLHLIRRRLGEEAAARVAREAVMPLERAGGQAQFIAYEPPDDVGTPIGNLIAWASQHLDRDLSLAVLARRAAMSTRTLSRRFRSQLGETPAAWLSRARVRRAQRLLETTDWSIERIASKTGFGSSSVLRQHFTSVLGTSPSSYRRAFAMRS